VLGVLDPLVVVEPLVGPDPPDPGDVVAFAACAETSAAAANPETMNRLAVKNSSFVGLRG